MRITSSRPISIHSISTLTINELPDNVLPSPYHIDALSSASIGLITLAAAHCSSLVNDTPLPQVIMPQPQLTLAFKPEHLYTIDGVHRASSSYLGGLHQCKDGWIRVLDAFKAHQNRVCKVLGLTEDPSRHEVGKNIKRWTATDLEEAICALALWQRSRKIAGSGSRVMAKMLYSDPSK